MKALSKLKAEEGIWMTDVPEPEVGHNDLLIKIRKPPSAVLTFTSTTGMSGRRKPFRYRWWSVTNMSAKWWVSARKCAALKLATASPAKAYHLRPLP
jgi:hypothetical protein